MIQNVVVKEIDMVIPTPVPTKPWYASKTIWLMVILTLSGILTQVSASLSQNPHPDAPGIMMMVVGVLGVILRVVFTNTAIS